MTSPNIRLSPAASRQRHHDSPAVIFWCAIVIGMAAMCILMAVALLLSQIV